MQSDMDELLHVKMEGERPELLIKVDSPMPKLSHMNGVSLLYILNSTRLFTALYRQAFCFENVSPSFLKIRVSRSIHMTCVL